MICEKHNCLFVHVPKTGGQSVERFFLALNLLTWEERSPLLLRYNDDPRKGPESLSHLYAREYIECGYLSEESYHRFYKFAFVRNPWDRIVSEYRYRYAGRFEFSDFIKNQLSVECAYCDKYRHIAPQCDFIFDTEGNQLVDFVGKFENLQEDFTQICEQLKIEDSKLPFVNSSLSARSRGANYGSLFRNKAKPKDKIYRQYYDSQTRGIVEGLYRRDVEQFNYVF